MQSEISPEVLAQHVSPRPKRCPSLAKGRGARRRVRFAPEIVFLDAALDGNLHEVEQLVESGIDVNTRSSQGNGSYRCS